MNHDLNFSIRASTKDDPENRDEHGVYWIIRPFLIVLQYFEIFYLDKT